MTPKREFRIETPRGFYSAYERIGGYNFPAKYNASYRSATVYDTEGRAKSILNSLRAKGHNVNLQVVNQ